MPLFHDCHKMRFYMNEVFACIKKSIDMVVHIYIEIKNKVKNKGYKKTWKARNHNYTFLN